MSSNQYTNKREQKAEYKQSQDQYNQHQGMRNQAHPHDYRGYEGQGYQNQSQPQAMYGSMPPPTQPIIEVDDNSAYSTLGRQNQQNQGQQNLVRHEDDVDQVCNECGERSMRIKQSEGIIVCMECGIVASDRIINFSSEVRNFGSDNPSQALQRVGQSIRPNEVNKMGTQLTLGPGQKKRNLGAFIGGLENDRHIQERKAADMKDYYLKYFKEMQYIFELKQIALNKFMDKVTCFLEVRSKFEEENKKIKDPNVQKKKVFTGKKLAYAANMLYLIVKDLKLNIELKDIVEASIKKKNDLDQNSLKQAKKNLQREFKDWFRSGRESPQKLMPGFVEQLNYPQELRDDAQTIVERVHRELESCHPRTVVGVALIMLNSSMPKKYAEFKKSDQEISVLIDRGLNNIKEKYEKIRALEKYILPEHLQRRYSSDQHDPRRYQSSRNQEYF